MRVKTLDGKEITLHADLMVDCTGGSQSGLQWLKDLELENGENFGLERKSYTHYVVYTYCEVDIPDAKLPDLQRILNKKRNDHAEKLHSIHEWWLTEPDMDVINFGSGEWITTKVSSTMSAFVPTLSHNTLVYIGYGGYGVKEWPKSIHGFREIALRLCQAKPMAQWVFEFFEFREKEEFPIKIDTMRLPPCLYINYAAAKNLPSNFVVIGDAIHKANPIKGDSEKATDYGYETTIPCKGEDLSMGEFNRPLERYLKRIAVTDDHVWAIMFDIYSCIEPGTLVLSPKILLGVFWLWTKEKLGYDLWDLK
ncbi:hypothetical protein M422DRAFT_65632 [Sphaerobolus stellatus SS14]|nr:hypothetical protein M422DRAFT_65632 [Sphaerobolus stellatus SS14]